MINLPSLTVKQKGLSLVALLLIIEIGFISFLGGVLYQSENSSRYEAAAKDLVSGYNQLYVMITKLDHYSYRYIGTGKKSYSDSYWKTLPALKESMDNLKAESAMFPSCAERVTKLASIIGDAVNLQTKMVTLELSGHYTEAGEIRKSDERVTKLAKVVSEMTVLQNELIPIAAKKAELALNSQSFVYSCLTAAVVCNILLAVFLALVFVKSITSRLALLADNSFRLARGLALNPALPQKDEIGQLDAMFHNMADAVQESARKERSLTENARDVICSIDADGKFLKLNPAANDNWGYEKEELLGKDASVLLPESERDKFKLALNSRATELDTEFESQILTKQGKQADVLWAIHWSELEQSHFSVIHDISERKQAELRLKESQARAQTVLNSMLVGVLTVTDKGFIESINPRTQLLLQYSEEELKGKALSPLFPDLKTSQSENIIQEIFRQYSTKDPDSKRVGHIPDLMAKCKNNELLPVELWLTELPAAQSDRYLVNILDVSARHELEKTKQEFVAIISQDLKAPLSSIRQFLNKLLNTEAQDKFRGEGKKRTELATRNIGRLLRLIEDLLEIDRLESGQLDLHCEIVNLGGIIQRAIEAIRGFGEQHKVGLEAQTVSIEINADADSLERVLINLASNAVKFSPEGQKVSIVVDEHEKDLIVKVIDRGRGVPASHRELIFERFKQVSSTDATQKGGTGLGLAICKAVVEQHGGSIGVDSEEGQGSTFWFKLPKLGT